MMIWNSVFKFLINRNSAPKWQNGIPTHNHLFCKRTLNHLANWPNWVLICTVHLTVCSYYVKYAFYNKSTLYSCLNVKELLPQSKRNIWSLSDCNGAQIYNHLLYKRTLNHLAKLAKWISCVVTTYLYRKFVPSETHTWLDNNIQSNTLYRSVIKTHFNHLACLIKWFSVKRYKTRQMFRFQKWILIGVLNFTECISK